MLQEGDGGRQLLRLHNPEKSEDVTSASMTGARASVDGEIKRERGCSGRRAEVEGPDSHAGGTTPPRCSEGSAKPFPG